MSQNKVLSVKDLSFTYPNTEEPVLKDLSFEIDKGEFVLLCGTSGSGKTTLAKCLNGIIPHLGDGKLKGEILVNGINTQQVEIHELSSEIGMVFQNPEDQIFSLRVEDEVAFGVECQGYTQKEIRERTAYALNKLRIEDLKRHLTFALSGGQKQKVSIASNLAMLPSILILDDPTTDLDPVSKQEVMDILSELKNEIDTTFLVIEHDLNDLLEFADRVIIMHEGEILYNGKPVDIFYDKFYELDEIGIRIPDHIRLAKYLLESGHALKDNPLSKEVVFEWAKTLTMEKKLVLPNIVSKQYRKEQPEQVACIKNVDFEYNGTKRRILHDVCMDIKKGEFLAIVGHNGCGKSTLMKNIIGLLHPCGGSISINSNDTKKTRIEDLILDIGYVFQNPDNQLFCNKVTDEIEFGLRNRDYGEEYIQSQTAKALKIVGLEDKKNEHPFSLSRGERQRLAVATMLVSDPKIIMLDEPTTGQDERKLKSLLELMRELVENQGATMIMVTHDMEVVAKYATRIIVVNGGRIVLDGTPDDIFYKHNDLLTSLKLKPPIISEMSARLAACDCGFPYIPNWDVFQEQVIDAERTLKREVV